MPIKTDRSLAMYILLGVCTCGIYVFYFIYSLARDLNQMCEGDGEKTPGLAAYIGLCIITCGIYGLWWMYKIGNRLQANAPRYGLCFIGPFIAMNILIKNTNALAGAYNNRLYNNA